MGEVNEIVEQTQTKEYKQLLYDVWGASVDYNIHEHPIKQMKKLGYDVIAGVPQSIAGYWWFTVEDFIEPLEPYLDKMHYNYNYWHGKCRENCEYIKTHHCDCAFDCPKQHELNYVFGNMRSSTEEENKLFSDMLDRISKEIDKDTNIFVSHDTDSIERICTIVEEKDIEIPYCDPWYGMLDTGITRYCLSCGHYTYASSLDFDNPKYCSECGARIVR